MKLLRRYQQLTTRLVRMPDTRYIWIAAGILGVSTIIWSSSIARLQQGNADQLADGFLFTSAKTFHQAQFPVAHTQLLKWPLFWLLAVFHNSPNAYLISTTLLSLITVAGLAYVLFRIVRSPLLLGALYLSLSCALVLIPAQVLPDASSPLSMAMVTGRNIEYLWYLAALALLIPSKTTREWQHVSLTIFLLSLLFASDKLFLIYSVGGALGLLLYAYIWKRNQLMMVGQRWLMASTIGWILSQCILWILGHITHIVTTQTSYSHVPAIMGTHGAVAYGLQDLLLNFGISPHVSWLTLVPMFVNIFTLIAVIYAVDRITNLVHRSADPPTRATIFSLLLGLSTVMAFISYIATSHLYAADARYLSITLFTGFVLLATYSRTVHMQRKFLYGFTGVATAAVICGLIATVRQVNHTLVVDPLKLRNTQIAQLLTDHHEQILVGDFWRVLPIKEDMAKTNQAILPLTGCLQPRQILASNAWKENLYIHSFAYLLPLQQSGSSFGRCSFQTIIMAYGQPSSIARVAGTQRNPVELLLFYNNGAARLRGKRTAPSTPVFGVPTDGTARPTGSTIVPLTDPS